MIYNTSGVRLFVAAIALLGVPGGGGSAEACRRSVEPDLSAAIRMRDAAQVNALIAQGADVNERDEGSEQTPLMRAIQVGDIEIARALLAHGARINTRDDDGKTALTFALAESNTELIRLLKENGAKPVGPARPIAFHRSLRTRSPSTHTR